MFKYILLVSLLLLSGCTLNPFATPNRMDTVEVVKYTPYTKTHQLYIPRDKLKKFKNKIFLKYFYSKKKKELYILTQTDTHFFLYNVTKPNTKKITINKKKYPYPQLVKKLHTAHILPIGNLTSLAYQIETHYRKLSNIKTLYLKITNYQKLQKAYKKALLEYNINYINRIQDTLPKKYIYTNYLKSKNNARTNKEKKHFSFIAKKLGFLQSSQTTPLSNKKTKNHTNKNNKIDKKVVPEKVDRLNTVTEQNITTHHAVKDKNTSITQTITKDTPYKKKPYQYFLLSSDIKEINTYLKEAKRNKSLSVTQYKKLLARKIFLKETYLLKHANIAELIRAYKINQKPVFKKRIMQLMKEQQEVSSTPI